MIERKDSRSDRDNKTNTVKGQVNGTFETQAITDTTDRFEETNIPKPSDSNVKEARDWVDHNKK